MKIIIINYCKNTGQMHNTGSLDKEDKEKILDWKKRLKEKL